MKQLIIFRFSAMGDVALLTPVVQAIARQYPDRQLTVVTRPKLAAFFEGISGVSVFPADLQGRHKGLKGLYQLYRDLKKGNDVEYVIDTHQNLRTSILKAFFALSGVRFTTIDKGRADKKALTRPVNKVLKQLPHSIERYLKTFEKAGYSATIAAPPYFSLTNQEALERFLADEAIPAKSSTTQWIGLAPFAQHTQKMWPFDRMQKVLELITQQKNVRIFLFGGGEAEIAQLRTLEEAFPQALLVAGKLSFQAELTLINQLDLMICMDSSNMHLATLNGVPVVSIWGATHPFAGFGPWMQSEENIVQIPTEELSCRPCSVFGNKPCARGDLACLNWITPEMVAERAIHLLQHH